MSTAQDVKLQRLLFSKMSTKRVLRILCDINNAIARRPLFWGLSLCAVEAMTADAFTQRVLEKKTEFQWYRLQTFGIFNTCEGGVDYFMINRFLPWLFREIPEHSIKAIIGKTIVYEILAAPTYYFPIFYYVRQSLHDRDFSYHSFQRGMAHFRINYRRDIPAHWAIWVPVALITFSVIPKHLAIPWMVSCDLCWLLGLSFYRGDIRTTSNSEITDDDS